MRKNITFIYHLMVILIVWHNADATTTDTPEKETDSNRSISSIVQILDQNLLGMNGEPLRRTKQYIGLCILADWCPASRSFARHASDFHDLFGDEVTLVLINPGKRSDWFFGRYRIPWTTVRASAVAPCSKSFRSNMPRNSFWWMRKEPTMTGRTGRINWFKLLKV